MITIEIDGKKCKTEPGKMIIEVADENEVNIPRFCYHKKLSIAANCRMCLVDVEKVGKPLPACATPVSDGMRVHTTSEKALDAQKSVMEFLLINHPLDCPICDQGGECELQDISMGYGAGISRYTEGKRSIDDENLGSLISTDMTRCIHCTRCVRFGEEIAGVRELGGTDRGEKHRIGTYVEKALVSEVSGNVIDLCPVGALTNKPFRFTARAWELEQHESVSPHDCLGTNIFIHTRRNEVMRVVPKDNEAINETWIADRDRYSVYGLRSEDRVGKPMIKRKGKWQETDWQTALKFTEEGLKDIIDGDPHQFAAVASPNSTLEEFYLLQKLVRGLGSNNIDHRIRHMDFSDQDHMPLQPGMDFPYAELEGQQAILLVGLNIHREQPLTGLRIRKAVIHGARAMAINPMDFTYSFPVNEKMVSHPLDLPEQLGQVAKALAGNNIPEDAKALLADVVVTDTAKSIAEQLKQADRSVIVFGTHGIHHPHAAVLRSLALLICELSGTKYMELPLGGNNAGAWLAGAVPHRDAAGKKRATPGLTVFDAFNKGLKAYLLMGVEPSLDYANPQLARKALEKAQFVTVLSTFKNANMEQYADVILPIAPFTETSGTYVNVEGRWQSFNGCVQPFEEVRPGWKVLRVLGNFFELDGFDYNSTDEIRYDVKQAAHTSEKWQRQWHLPRSFTKANGAMYRISAWPVYRVDSMVRRSEPLQRSATNEGAVAHINGNLALTLNKKVGDTVTVEQDGGSVTLPLMIDERVPDNCAFIPAGFRETAPLGHPFGEITIT